MQEILELFVLIMDTTAWFSHAYYATRATIWHKLRRCIPLFHSFKCEDCKAMLMSGEDPSRWWGSHLPLNQ